ncbi:MAG: Rpp14/Pop5 family protein [Nanoarchaeota archaeon]
MLKKKIKPLLPSLREKKRYLAFEVLSKAKINAESIEQKILDSSLNYLGQKGVSKAGIMVLKDKYNQELQKGLIRVNNKEVSNVRSALALIDKIDEQKVIVRTVGVSGILKKALSKYIAG